MQRCVLPAVMAAFCPGLVSSLYFLLAEGERTCFLEEIPDQTVLIGDCRTHLYHEQKGEYLPANHSLGMFVQVKDPGDELVLSQRVASEGRFRFTSQTPGGHRVCLQPTSSQRPLSAGRLLAVHLDIRAGKRTENYAEVARRDKLTKLQLGVRQLTEQLQQIQKEHEYQRIREKRFRDVSYSTNMWIFWWPVVRSIYVVTFIIWLTGSW